MPLTIETVKRLATNAIKNNRFLKTKNTAWYFMTDIHSIAHLKEFEPIKCGNIEAYLCHEACCLIFRRIA